ncbi:CoA transferase [Streptomyces sp. NBC_00344]|uniref:CoA transferase n=1 Tax=Streptomyces sp. NBC_00344 TaxID=2975720 RepID=UPI002E1D2031
MTPVSPTGTPAEQRAWEALGGDPSLLASITHTGPCGLLPARLPVMDLARGTVAVCSLAAAELAAARTGGPLPRVRIDAGAVATAFVSERHLLVDGRAPVSFAPLSGFWRAADGWVRTHANYPHHRKRLLGALGLPADAGAAAVAGALADRAAQETEETVYTAGGLAVALRTPEVWAAHPQGAAVAARPLLTFERTGGGPRRLPAPASAGLPASGVRVLDLTRVIAGPVATRTLALLGADVLRIDAPQLPESQDAHSDTGFGKRSAVLDLAGRSGRRTFDHLLADADVVVTGYRPGALERFGLGPQDLAARRPGVIVAEVSAWGRYGPWAGRRGFDSLVQVASGIASVEGGPDGPGVLPAQALDHGTGYLLAAAVLRALTEGGGHLAGLALAGTAAWLLDSPRYDPRDWLTETGSPVGRLRHALPPVGFDGGPANWSRPPGTWGSDAPVWAG